MGEVPVDTTNIFWNRLVGINMCWTNISLSSNFVPWNTVASGISRIWKYFYGLFYNTLHYAINYSILHYALTDFIQQNCIKNCQN